MRGRVLWSLAVLGILGVLLLLGLRRVRPPDAHHYTGGRCAFCHGSTHLPTHTGEFLATTHGAAAQADPASCQACHAPATCQTCHQSRQPAWHGDGVRRPSGGAMAWREHAALGSEHRDGCGACHAATFRAGCAACHTEAVLGRGPWPVPAPEEPVEARGPEPSVPVQSGPAPAVDQH